MKKIKKIVYCTPSLYAAGGIERVLSIKASYLADVLGYDITIILTDGKDKKPFYLFSNKIHFIQLDINFDNLWAAPFINKIFLYLKKQHTFKRKLKETLFKIKPDLTISLLRREINFINKINDGSIKIGELHVNKLNYRNFEKDETNLIKYCFSYFWQRNLIRHLRKLSKLVVLSNEDRAMWTELDNVTVIPNSLPFFPDTYSNQSQKRIIAVGRYTYQKGFDLLLKTWSIVEKNEKDWSLSIFGDGERKPYQKIADELGLDPTRCMLNGRVENIDDEYRKSSIFVLSSRFEGFGMVLIEAMANGLAPISFSCPCGPSDIIQNGKNGILVSNENITELAQQIIRLIQDAKTRKKISEAALIRSHDYDIKQIGKEWQLLFNKLEDCNP